MLLPFPLTSIPPTLPLAFPLVTPDAVRDALAAYPPYDPFALNAPSLEPLAAHPEPWAAMLPVTPLLLALTLPFVAHPEPSAANVPLTPFWFAVRFPDQPSPCPASEPFTPFWFAVRLPLMLLVPSLQVPATATPSGLAVTVRPFSAALPAVATPVPAALVAPVAGAAVPLAAPLPEPPLEPLLDPLPGDPVPDPLPDPPEAPLPWRGGWRCSGNGSALAMHKRTMPRERDPG